MSVERLLYLKMQSTLQTKILLTKINRHQNCKKKTPSTQLMKTGVLNPVMKGFKLTDLRPYFSLHV